MFIEYLKTLAQACREIFQEMTGTPVVSLTVKREQRLSENYVLALAVDFADPDRQLDGQVLMGFGDHRHAILMAAAMQEKLGLPICRRLDLTAVDALGEFLNTVVGRTVTQWDSAGLKANFTPPRVLTESYQPTFNTFQADSYVIILHLSFGGVVFSATFLDRRQQLKGKKVMVVDDSRLIRGLLIQALGQLQLVVAEAGDGLEATRMHQEFNPDLTIMDLVMPKMGGLDAIIEIREHDPMAKFIIITSTGKQEERLTAGTLGVCDYLLKPVNVEVLVDAVKKALLR